MENIYKSNSELTAEQVKTQASILLRQIAAAKMGLTLNQPIIIERIREPS